MKLIELLKSTDRKLVSIYCTAGFPKLNSLPHVVDELGQKGIDFIEVGIPYSDPLCDGPTIQNSSTIALQNGITLQQIFDQLTEVKSNIPLVMMGYFNVVLQYGVEKFCQSCKAAGIQAVILPDLPLELYRRSYADLFSLYGMHMIFLVTPQTTEARIREIDSVSQSFIYAVSTSSTTGSNSGIMGSEAYLKRLQSMKLKHPIMVGFNIANASDVQFANQFARGVIIGSAFIRELAATKDSICAVAKFIDQIKVST